MASPWCSGQSPRRSPRGSADRNSTRPPPQICSNVSPRGARIEPAGVCRCRTGSLPARERGSKRRRLSYGVAPGVVAPRRRGATSGAQPTPRSPFPSALPRGERPASPASAPLPTGFDPRSRAGSDPRPICDDGLVSSFDPRSRAGSDVRWTARQGTTIEFRSALPRGERLLRFKQRKRQTKVADFREAGFAAPSHQGTEQHTFNKNLIYRDKDPPRTSRGNAGRSRFALRA